MSQTGKLGKGNIGKSLSEVSEFSTWPVMIVFVTQEALIVTNTFPNSVIYPLFFKLYPGRAELNTVQVSSGSISNIKLDRFYNKFDLYFELLPRQCRT